MAAQSCVVCNGPVTLVPAGTDCGGVVLRHDLLSHTEPGDQFAPRPHAPLVRPRRKARRK